MGVLFISHSSRNNDRAITVRDWLAAQGWSDVFLDLDPDKGLAPGHLWQEELRKASEACSAVIILLSPDWLASTWCQTEFVLAEQFGKRIFPLLVAPTPARSIRPDLRDKYQIGDISTAAVQADGLARLAIGLRRAGLDPQSFPWPPPGEPERPVYRGLQPLDVQDAAVFFGRDAAITAGLDELRRLRAGAPQRMMVVLGASGAGKSSFLRAGLVARLQRDELNFITLPVIRPGRETVTGPEGLARAIATALGREVALTDATSLARAFADIRAPVADRIRRQAQAAGEAWAAKPPTIIVPIDQAEALFAADTADRSAFCDMLEGAFAADGNALVVATIRTDAYAPLQRGWMPASQLVFSLPPLAAGAFQEVIEGPARLARPPVALEPALTQRLLADLASADALPLLAFSLERLQSSFGGAGRLTLNDYRSGLGGVGGAIRQAVARALGEDAAALSLARRLFIPALVQVDDDGVKRRIARRTDAPRETWALADRFVAERLLIADRREIDGREAETLEVAHEALFRQWPALDEWIAEERDALRALAAAASAAREWAAHRGERGANPGGWLAHRGERLTEARLAASRPDFAPLVTAGVNAYLDACEREERSARRRRQALQTLAVALGAAIVVGSVTYAFQFEIRRTWAQMTMARIRPAAALAAAAPLSAFKECAGGLACPEMVILPAGRFVMGSPPDEAPQFPDEQPQHAVAVGRFAISRSDVSVAEWLSCVAYTNQNALARTLERHEPIVGCAYSSDSGFGGGQHPAINVSWDDAQGYVRWLNLMLTGDANHGPYRLASEAEWEYAARAGTTTAFFWGADPAGACTHANGMTAATKDKYPAVQADKKDAPPCDDPFMETSPAGAMQANPFGLNDMSGNVWQWVQDCYAPYGAAPATAAAVARPACQKRVLRGGSWRQPPHTLRSARRGKYEPTSRYFDVGFRIARSL